MSWSLFKTRCNVLTGNQHVSHELFAQTISSAYHECMSLHFDSMTAAGVFINNAPAVAPLYQSLLTQCEANLQSGGSQIDLLMQMGPMIITYHTALIIVGPTGTVTVTSPGTWTSIPVPQNMNFQIMLDAMQVAMQTHLMTLVGIYVSSVVAGVTSPWSGALLQCMP